MKKIVCIALAACFMVALVSFSSSAEVVNDVTNLNVSSLYFYPESDAGIGSQYFVKNGNEWQFDVYLPYSEPTPLFECLYFAYDEDYSIPSYSGRPLSLSFNVDFTVFNTGYLSYIPDDVNITHSAIFTGCYLLLYFKDGSIVSLMTDTFILKDDDIGEFVDPHSSEYWESIKGDIMDLSIYALFDVSQYYDKVIDRTFICFPDSSPRTIYYSNDFTSTFLNIGNIVTTYDFAYSPFNDVVQDDLTDIKDSFSGVNSKLDSISSSMNTIDQDVNRVNQSVTDLKDTIEDFQEDLTSFDSSISSDISDKEDIINSIQDAMQNDNALLEDNLNDMITGFPGAQDPFHNAPSPDGFFAVQFIQQLWSFIKAQTVFFDFIFLGLCFCLATFILRR